MKKLFKKSLFVFLISATLLITTGCKKDWLKPEPLSTFTPGNAYIDAAGMRTALVACARNARIEYYGDNPPILTEMVFSEVTAEGTTDKSGPAQDLNLWITPDAATAYDDADHAKLQFYWRKDTGGSNMPILLSQGLMRQHMQARRREMLF